MNTFRGWGLHLSSTQETPPGLPICLYGPHGVFVFVFVCVSVCVCVCLCMYIYVCIYMYTHTHTHTHTHIHTCICIYIYIHTYIYIYIHITCAREPDVGGPRQQLINYSLVTTWVEAELSRVGYHGDPRVIYHAPLKLAQLEVGGSDFLAHEIGKAVNVAT